MLDARMRPLIDPPLNWIGKHLALWGVHANWVTLTGFVFGLFAIVAIAQQHFNLGLFFLVMNRLCDGVDGGVARYTAVSDFGGFLDILCDFIIYSGIIFAFALAHIDNVFAASFLLFSYIGPITSFLAYAIIAAKKEINTQKRGKKSFYYLGGLCEGSETFFIMVLMCLFPHYFSLFAYAYGILCWLTTFGRGLQAWRDFGAH